MQMILLNKSSPAATAELISQNAVMRCNYRRSIYPLRMNTRTVDYPNTHTINEPNQ